MILFTCLHYVSDIHCSYIYINYNVGHSIYMEHALKSLFSIGFVSERKEKTNGGYHLLI